MVDEKILLKIISIAVAKVLKDHYGFSNQQSEDFNNLLKGTILDIQRALEKKIKEHN